MEKDTRLIDGDREHARDNFYHGVISKIFWSNETGVIHSDSGKEVPFIFAFVTLLGAPRQDINFLRPGMRVGFDVGWTSKGLRASTIKIYDLYQDDIIPEASDGPAYPPEAPITHADHPISRYRPQPMYETTEPPRYRQRRSRPRLQESEQNPTDAPQLAAQDQPRPEPRPPVPHPQEPNRAEMRPQRQEQPRSQQRPDGRPRGQEQNRPDPRMRGQEQRRSDGRLRGQDQRRQEPRPQTGQRRDEPPRPLPRPNAGAPNAGPTDTSSPEERARRSRRRGRR